jgi:hypothetical protein
VDELDITPVAWEPSTPPEITTQDLMHMEMACRDAIKTEYGLPEREGVPKYWKTAGGAGEPEDFVVLECRDAGSPGYREPGISWLSSGAAREFLGWETMEAAR